MNQLLFRNLHPFLDWMFSITWTTGTLIAAAYVVRKGNVTGDPTSALIFGLFALFAFWIDFHALTVPMVSIWQVDVDDWLIVRRWIWKAEREHVNPVNLPMPRIEEGSDGEGARDYRCCLRTPSGVVEFGKHHRHEGAERACVRMRNLLRDRKHDRQGDTSSRPV